MLLQNEAGALARVAGLFSARGYNIESLTVAATLDASVSRLTLVTIGDDAVIEQIVKQSRKLLDVIEIADLTTREHLETELVMLKVDVEDAALPAGVVRHLDVRARANAQLTKAQAHPRLDVDIEDPGAHALGAAGEVHASDARGEACLPSADLGPPYRHPPRVADRWVRRARPRA